MLRGLLVLWPLLLWRLLAPRGLASLAELLLVWWWCIAVLVLRVAWVIVPTRLGSAILGPRISARLPTVCASIQ